MKAQHSQKYINKIVKQNKHFLLELGTLKVSKTFILVSTDGGEKGTGKAVAKVSEYAPSLQSQHRASRGLKEKKELKKKKDHSGKPICHPTCFTEC